MRHDVKAETARATTARTTLRGIRQGQPGAFVTHLEYGPAPVAACQGNGEGDPLWRMREHVVEQVVEQIPQVVVAHCHRQRARHGGEVEPTLLVLGKGAPEGNPFRDNGIRVARAAEGLLGRAPSLRDDRVHGPTQVVDVTAHSVAELRFPDRVRVELKCSDRGAQPVRKVGGDLPLGDKQAADSVSQLVESLAEIGDFAGAGYLRSHSELALAQPVGDRRKIGDGRADPARQCHRHPDRQGEQGPAGASNPHPGGPHPRVQLRVRHRRADNRDPVGNGDWDQNGSVFITDGEGSARGCAAGNVAISAHGRIRRTGNLAAEEHTGRPLGGVRKQIDGLIDSLSREARNHRSDALRFLLTVAQRPVLRKGANEQAERNDERQDDRRRCRGDEPPNLATHDELRLRRGEPHANAPHAVQVPRLRGRLAQFAAQPRQVDVDRALRAAIRLTPDVGKNFLLAHDLPGALSKEPEKVKLLARQVNHRPVAGDYSAAWVDGQPGDRDRGRASLTRGSTQDRADARVELRNAEWLDHVVIGAGIEGLDRGFLGVAGGRDDDGNRADRAQHRQHLQPVNVGQAKVKEDKIRLVVHGIPQAVHAGRHICHRVPARGEAAGERRTDVGIIFDDENGRHRRHPSQTNRHLRHTGQGQTRRPQRKDPS